MQYTGLNLLHVASSAASPNDNVPWTIGVETHLCYNLPMNSEWYLSRNELVIEELHKEVDNGLIFLRKNPVRKKNAVTSSVGSFHSQTLDQEVFVTLKEFKDSSASLKTIVHLSLASWYTENFTRPSNQVSAFYGLLVDDNNEEIGMLYEDITRGGVLPVVPSVRLFDPTISIVALANKASVPFPYSIITQFEVEGVNRITDFEGQIYPIVQQGDGKILDLDQFIEERKLPTVVLPY